jgi:hypothetical protein
MSWTRAFACALALAPWAPTGAASEAILDHEPKPVQIDDPTPQLFSVCYQHTCTQVAHLTLDAAKWKPVREVFQPSAGSAAEERERIRQAIAYLEVEIGRRIGTLGDVGGSFEGFLKSGNQLDCVDESTNSTTYLRMMERDGLLRYHRVGSRAARARSGGFIIGWPHFTAVIEEIASGEKWAVDSWFRNNGEPPEVVPLSLWRTGWEPES